MKEVTIDQFEVINIPAQWVAYRRVSCCKDKIGETITAPDVYPGIYELAAKHGTKPGPPYARYIQWRENDCDILCGVALSIPIQPEGNIIVDQYTACRIVRYTLVGPYSELGIAHEAVMSYIKEQGLTHGGPCWEIYDGPGDDKGNATVHVCYPIEL